jgi:predicted nuclease with RNAse H fold
VVIGIDVAAARLNCVALDATGSFAGGRIYDATEMHGLSEWATGADVIAIDAPAELSTAPHSSDEALSPKFRVARCAEVALGRDHRIWVPWTSPIGPPVPGWIATGLELYSALAKTVSSELVEVFPYAGFRVLTHPSRLSKKTAVAGIRQRVAVLRTCGLSVDDLELWSHDSLDAALAAIIALQHRNRAALRVTCGHDDSAIWLPVARRLSASPGDAPVPDCSRRASRPKS